VKCLIDSNVLISAWLFPGSVPDKAFSRALDYPFESIVCQYSIDEILHVCHRKWPEKVGSIHDFIGRLQNHNNLTMATFHNKVQAENLEIRDSSDAPILAVALEEDLDFIITGDKDFFQGRYVVPIAISPAKFAAIDEYLSVEEIAFEL
jgi:putative PIN family toxin of toxin-antitoxin system